MDLRRLSLALGFEKSRHAIVTVEHDSGMNFISYLNSSEPFATKKWAMFSWCILLLWLAVVVGVSCFHEMWRDEVRAWSLAISPESVWGLPIALKNEGHPMVWYLALRLGYLIFPSPVILKVAAITIAGIAIFLFFRLAPFATLFKLLFLLTFLPMYEYSVMARNYGISMLLFFLIASTYPHRKGKAFLVAVLLVILAHTNFHSAILVLFFSLFWFHGVFLEERSKEGAKSIFPYFFSFALVAAGLILAVLAVIPDENSIVLQGPTLQFDKALAALWENIRHPGTHYDVIFYGIPLWGRDLLLTILVIGLAVRPVAAFVLAGGIVAMGTFFSIGYDGVLRHQGIVFIFIIVLYWIVLQDRNDGAAWQRFFQPACKGVVYLVLPAIFLIHIAAPGRKYIGILPRR